MPPNAALRARDTGHGNTLSTRVKAKRMIFTQSLQVVISDADLGVFQFVSTTTFSFRCIFALTFARHRPQCVATQIGTRKSAVQNAATHAPETRFGARARHALGCNAAAQRAARGSNTLLTLILYYGRVCMCVCVGMYVRRGVGERGLDKLVQW